MTFSRSLAQRSRSGSDGHRNLMNSIASEPWKGLEAKRTWILTTVGARPVSKVTGAKVKVTGNIFQTFSCSGGTAYGSTISHYSPSKTLCFVFIWLPFACKLTFKLLKMVVFRSTLYYLLLHRFSTHGALCNQHLRDVTINFRAFYFVSSCHKYVFKETTKAEDSAIVTKYLFFICCACLKSDISF